MVFPNDRVLAMKTMGGELGILVGEGANAQWRLLARGIVSRINESPLILRIVRRDDVDLVFAIDNRRELTWLLQWRNDEAAVWKPM